MQGASQIVFPPFHLDLRNEQVWRGATLVALRPKTVAVLRYLVEHAGQVVTKEALLQAVWPHTYGSEGLPKGRIRELRAALGDDAQGPRFIETVGRRGYRWIAPLHPALETVTGRHGDTPLRVAGSPSPTLVGRDRELGQLQGWLEQVLAGERQVVFVTGEAGIGKTTLVDAFLARIAASRAVQSPNSFDPHSAIALVGQGQCIEHFGAGEAYLPVLTALGQLGRGPEGQEVIELLRRYAPTWLMQMPGLLSAPAVEELQRMTLGAMRERMLRELAEVVEMLTAERGLLLVLEDLQWSDAATVDWLAFVARRRQAARLMVIGTYRPAEVMMSGHPIRGVKHELQMHGQCAELALRPLNEAVVAEYLARRFASPSPASAGQAHRHDRWREGLSFAPLQKLAKLLHRRTEGNPLFLVNVVQELVARGVLGQHAGQWEMEQGTKAIAIAVPQSLRQLIEQQLERLSAEEQGVLEVASVAGAEFSAAVVAAGIETERETERAKVEDRCERLVRREQFLQARGSAEWPDGTVAGRYGFLHALYQEVLYERVPAGRRVALHRRLGARVEAAYGRRAHEIAAELAVHFERGRDYQRAVQYHHQAAETALRRSANVEAMAHLSRGLELLETLPDTPLRSQREIQLQLALAGRLMAAQSPAAPEVESAYVRARELCLQTEDTTQLFFALRGLWEVYLLRAEVPKTRTLAEELLGVARRGQDPLSLLEAYRALGISLLWLGEVGPAQQHFAHSVALYDPQRYHSYAFRNALDSRVSCLSSWSLALCHQGYPAQALQKGEAALHLARELGDPFSLAYALYFLARLHRFREEVELTDERTEALTTLATEQGLPIWVAAGALLRGWVLVKQGQGEEGIRQIHQGAAAWRGMGTRLEESCFLALLAEAHGKAGQAADGLAVVAEALAVVDKNGERVYEAELYRLKGELSLQSRSSESGVRNQEAIVSDPDPRPPTPDPQAEAEECFLQAIAIARRQSAKSLELRAVMSLCRLWQQQGKKKQARQRLAEIYGWFTEGFDTADLQEAKALLQELS